MMFPADDSTFHEPAPTPLYPLFAELSESNAWTSVNGCIAARSFTNVDDEYRALTEGFACIDYGPLRRYSLRGADAIPLLSRLTTAPTRSLSLGQSGRGLMLDARGGVITLCEVTHLGGDVFVLTAATPCDHWLRVAARGFDADVDSIDDQVAALGVFGPDAAEIAAAAGFAVADGGLAAQGRVRGVEVFIRPAMIGAIEGLEIVFPINEALIIFERLRRSAKPVAVGLDACEIARIEGGAPKLGLDFESASASGVEAPRPWTPLEIGLPHLAPTDRGWFNGRKIVRDAAPCRRLAVVAVEADQVSAGAAVYGLASTSSYKKSVSAAVGGGAAIGVVRSAVYSPARRGALAMVEIFGPTRPGRMLIDVRASDGESARVAATLIETHENSLAAAYLDRQAAATESVRRAV